jgi:hypothetical protein
MGVPISDRLGQTFGHITDGELDRAVKRVFQALGEFGVRGSVYTHPPVIRAMFNYLLLNAWRGRNEKPIHF